MPQTYLMLTRLDWAFFKPQQGKPTNPEPLSCAVGKQVAVPSKTLNTVALNTYITLNRMHSPEPYTTCALPNISCAYLHCILSVQRPADHHPLELEGHVHDHVSIPGYKRTPRTLRCTLLGRWSGAQRRVLAEHLAESSCGTSRLARFKALASKLAAETLLGHDICGVHKLSTTRRSSSEEVRGRWRRRGRSHSTLGFRYSTALEVPCR